MVRARLEKRVRDGHDMSRVQKSGVLSSKRRSWGSNELTATVLKITK
jgi:hypothetical protein